MNLQRATDLIQILALQPHPEGGWYREIHRSTQPVYPGDGRPQRCALTSIDFLLQAGQRSAWHQVASDEAWHLLEGGPLRLWLLPPEGNALQVIDLAPVDAQGRRPRAVVPAHWWQAAEPLPADAGQADPQAAGWACVGATVGPGFEFADFRFGRDDAALRDTLARHHPGLLRLL